ncbi:MAG: CoA transferase [Castellaniella sp.]|uniref:CaiB/BaiF CoA transferase family protein n=1 Tax=Castellaniella sp. TaxID=1955812 RepID=UPI001219F3E8|nr:CoA transferase [Castellaniella sp.]TAN27582.1 MAG: CoA transferase [Castellaniella sp.]
MALPLEGIRVLSFAQLGQGPAATQMLGDYGAEVIKVERPGVGAWERGTSGAGCFRDGENFFFLSLNRNKKSFTLNLKDKRAIEIIDQLIPTVDIVVENYRPGVMDRLDLGYDRLSGLNPRLVYARSTGYGSEGPYRDLPGQDLLVQGVSGLAAMGGKDGELPVPASIPILDMHAAALLALGVCMALIQRGSTGRGQLIETSLLEAAVHLQAEPLFYFVNGWDITKRSKSGLASPYHPAPYGVYQSSDGSFVLSVVPLQTLATVFAIPELSKIDQSEATQRRDEIKRLLDQVTPTKSTAQWLDVCKKYDVWCAPVLTYHSLVEDPQFRYLDFLHTVLHPKVGEVHMIRSPLRLSGSPLSALPNNAPPTLGQNTDELLMEIGLDAADIRLLRHEGVV